MNISNVHGGGVGEGRRVRARTDAGPDPVANTATLPAASNELANADTIVMRMFASPRVASIRLNAADLVDVRQREKVLDALWMHSTMADARMDELDIVEPSSESGHGPGPSRELRAGDLRILKHVPTLKSLEFENVRVGKAALEQVKHLSNLRDLQFKHVDLDDSRLEFLRHLTALRHLGLQDTHISEGSVEQLRHVPHLRSLRLESASVDGEELVHLAPLQALTYLDISRNEAIEDEHLAHIDKLQRLEWLDVTHTSINGTGLEDIPNLELRGLRWNTFALGDTYETLTPELAKLTSLEELSIGCGNLESKAEPEREGLEPLRALPNLRRLEIDNLDNVCDTDLASLAHIESLADVDLANSEGFTRAGLEGLLANTSLRNVRISETELVPFAAELQAKYPHCTIVDE